MNHVGKGTREILDCSIWKGQDEASILKNLSKWDRFVAEVFACDYETRGVLIRGLQDYVSFARQKWHEDIWRYLVTSWKIVPDYAFVKECKLRSAKIPVNPRAIYLDTWLIDEDKSYHPALMGRMDENSTFGSHRLYEWFSFFLTIYGFEEKKPSFPIELRYIAGMVESFSGVMFKQKWGDNSVLTDVKGFYNTPNLVESLLTVSMIRLSLNLSEVSLCGVKYSLLELLDECALRMCVSPKYVIKEIRTYLTFVVRMFGCRSEAPMTLRHAGWVRGDNKVKEDFISEPIDKDSMSAFWNSKVIQDAYELGRKALKDVGMSKMSAICEALLDVSMNELERESVGETIRLLQSVLMIAGYGRALKYASSPRSVSKVSEADPLLPKEFEDDIVRFSELSEAEGCEMCTGESWQRNCLSYWRSTSAGVEPMYTTITATLGDGTVKTDKVKVTKKMAIAMLLGDSGFRRTSLAKIYDVSNPGTVGYRDVPYKPTRAIYCVGLPTLHAQIAVASHIVEYASMVGTNKARSFVYYDASNISSGREAMSGIRIFDNYETIASSGCVNTLYLGTDLSEYDSHNIWWNFREPMLNAFKRMYAGKTKDRYLYGPEKIPPEEMIDYAFGTGHIYDTLWDNGREPLIYLDRESSVPSGQENLFTKIMIGPDVKVKVSKGLMKIPEGEVQIFDLEKCLEEGLTPDWSVLRVGYRSDGGDFVHLTSEASGELTTLCMNSLLNLSMQKLVLQDLKQTKLGRKLKVHSNYAVGDDAEIFFEILEPVTDPDEVDEFFRFLSAKYASFGHVLSVFKFFFMLFSSEYVQTFARFGYYLPRDQISLINSEKPRKVLDPLGFLHSMRGVILAKCARGFNLNFAKLCYVFFFEKLTRVDLRRHVVNVGEFSDFLVDKSLPAISVRKVTWKKVEKFRSEDMFVIRFNIANAFLPSNARGGMFNPVLLGLSHSPAMFLWWIGTLPGGLKNDFANLYLYMRDKAKCLDSSGDRPSDVKIKVEKVSLNPADLFSKATWNDIQTFQRLEVGRYNAENLPRQLLKEGLKMERFMEQYQLEDRESFSEAFLKTMRRRFTISDLQDDEWLMAYDVIFDKIDKRNCKNYLFITGLNDVYKNILSIFGLNNYCSRLRVGMEIMRRVIARDPVLKGIRSPEEVLSVLDDFGVETVQDYTVGWLVLARMGFENSVRAEILRLRFGDMPGGRLGNVYGALSDDFFGSLNLVTSSRMEELSFHSTLDRAAKLQAITLAMQRSIYMMVLHDFEEDYLLMPSSIVKREDISKNVIMRFPMTYKDLVSKRRQGAGLSLRFLQEVQNSERYIDSISLFN